VHRCALVETVLVVPLALLVRSLSLFFSLSRLCQCVTGFLPAFLLSCVRAILWVINCLLPVETSDSDAAASRESSGGKKGHPSESLVQGMGWLHSLRLGSISRAAALDRFLLVACTEVHRDRQQVKPFCSFLGLFAPRVSGCHDSCTRCAASVTECHVCPRPGHTWLTRRAAHGPGHGHWH
jgi:hypothetical protein